MRGIITGGTGFLGTAVIDYFDADFTILTRNPCADNHIQTLEEVPDDADVDFIINFAGEPIADKRWTYKQKQKIIDSRISTTQAIVKLVERLHRKPKVVISGSAIGYYGFTREPCVEDTPPQDIFISSLCQNWEKTIKPVANMGIRLCIVRTGVVLDKGKGMLAKMYLPFMLGLGGKIGSGTQIISWIHIEDYVRILYEMLVNEDMHGPYNCCAPNPVSNKYFAKTFASILHRPAIIPMPTFSVKLIFGEMGNSLLLHGQKVIPERLVEQGFHFNYSSIKPTLDSFF